MFEDITQVVDNNFWKLINDLRVHEARGDRISMLASLSDRLQRHEYFPGLPLTVMEADKGYGVARQIPIYDLDDYSVYYYCVRKLEHVLAKNRVSGTFGGWSMGGRLRKLEQEEDAETDYMLTYSYNPAAWAKYYGDYNARLYGEIKQLRESGCQDYLVFELDIANFYDNIQLAILEKKIRHDADYSEAGILDLLMYFLGYSNRLVTQYQKRSVGVPQDAFGDCSRILANYYLQDYDFYMSNLALKYNSVYIRYADDQILFVPDDAKGRELIHMASRRLAGLGLNINQKKVIKRTLDELYIYRSFEIHDLFKPKDANKDKATVCEFARIAFKAIDTDASSLKSRGYPLLKRLVTADYNLLEPSHRAKLMGYIFSEEFIRSCKANSIKSAYTKMRDLEKRDYLKLLEILSLQSRHSAFHYELLAFYRREELDTKKLEDRISDLKKNLFEVE